MKKTESHGDPIRVIVGIVLCICLLTVTALLIHNVCANFEFATYDYPTRYSVVFSNNVGANNFLTKEIHSRTSANRSGYVDTPSEPTRLGYDFAGWYKEPECINEFIFNEDPVHSNITLYAKWIKETSNKDTACKVEFTINEMSSFSLWNTIHSTAYANSDGYVNTPSEPARPGYAFAGWYNEPECINPFIFSKDTVHSNITLYAKWIKKS